MTLENSTVLSQSGGALATEVDGEVVLIGIDTGQYYGLDAIGSNCPAQSAQRLGAHSQGNMRISPR